MQPYAHIEAVARTIICIEQFENTRTHEDAAHAAAHALMHTTISDARGQTTTIFDLAEDQDCADAIEHAACDLFIVLTREGMTYREFIELSGVHVLGAPRQVRAAVRHFHTVLCSVKDLYRMVIERGEVMLAPFDWHIDNYLRT